MSFANYKKNISSLLFLIQKRCFFGLGTASDTLKVEEVNVISNEDCNEHLRFNISGKRGLDASVKEQLPGGITDFHMCTLGNNNAISDTYTVCSSNLNCLLVERLKHWKFIKSLESTVGAS